MIGVILAAGMAKRLRPLTDTKPKCLLKVGKRTLLERTVRAMQQAGITEFVVVTGYRGDMIRSFLENMEFPDNPKYPENPAPHFTFLHNTDYEHNNNIYSLWMAGEVVRGREFLLMDSDILCDPPLWRLTVMSVARRKSRSSWMPTSTSRKSTRRATPKMPLASR